VTSRKTARPSAEEGSAKLRWATPDMRLWLGSLQNDYALAKPKHVFVNARIIDFLVLFPDALPGVDWSGKDTWTFEDIQARLTPAQREIFESWITVRPYIVSCIVKLIYSKRLGYWWSNALRVHRPGNGSTTGIVKMFKTICAAPKRRTRINGYAELYSDEVRQATNDGFENWQVRSCINE
jgi:hypothetical protein